MQQQVAGAIGGSIAYTLAAIKDWTFWLGPGWVVGWGNGLILGYLMYRSGLVPRWMAWLGLVGGPPESSLGIYCTVWGFRRSSPILRADAHDDRVKRMLAPTPA